MFGTIAAGDNVSARGVTVDPRGPII